MRRHALRSAAGRAASSSRTTAALRLPIHATTPASFSTSPTGRGDGDGDSKNRGAPRPFAQSDAIQRLSRLNSSGPRAGNINNNNGLGQQNRPGPGARAVRPRFGAGLRGGRFGGMGGRGDRRGGFRRDRKGAGDKKRSRGPEPPLEIDEEAQAYLDQLDVGEVVRFDPKVTAESLIGYGAAVATDSGPGQIETLLRNMRLMSGGMAFNAHAGVTTDLHEVAKKGWSQTPVFVNTMEEKAWIHEGRPNIRLVTPSAELKKAIVEPALLGKYNAPTFAEAGNVAATVANYHSRTFTYTDGDSKKFMDKVLSLLPPSMREQGGPPAQPRK
ncbi:uncharacterized protein C8A04DRAFT_15078 [Dichotomopilus funicola]|uniref:Uncharacterized protein n=1 Tax=Dichotomopilus funicola TaxID=1934379 RepID=A0AAN6UWL7_9PEZI|nr:hypothetical protein C8A04DRAFT_15078 [Dichotomopilus funicola]